MITKLIVDMFMACLDALISLLPSWSPPIFDPFSFISIAFNANRVFPVATALLLLAAIIVLRLAMNLWDHAVFVYHQFWGSD